MVRVFDNGQGALGSIIMYGSRVKWSKLRERSSALTYTLF